MGILSSAPFPEALNFSGYFVHFIKFPCHFVVLFYFLLATGHTFSIPHLRLIIQVYQRTFSVFY